MSFTRTTSMPPSPRGGEQRPAKPLSLSGHISQFFPPSPAFHTSDLPALPGIRALITGGTSGIGLSTARALLRAGASVCLASRCPVRGDAAVRALSLEFPDAAQRVWFLPVDLGDLRSVRRAAALYASRESTLHLLFLNAGVMHSSRTASLARSQQGHDEQFAINALGHYHFTLCLLPVLLHTQSLLPSSPRASLDSLVPPSLNHSSAPTSTSSHEPEPRCAEEAGAAARIGVRIITVSSNSHHFAPTGAIDWATLDPFSQPRAQDRARRKLGGLGLYAQSKMANILLSNHLSRQLSHTGLVFISAHPGGIRTALTRGAPKWQAWITNLILYPPEMGALTSLWAGTSADGAALNGKYCIPWARVGEPRADAEDWGIAERLVGMCRRMCEGY